MSEQTIHFCEACGHSIGRYKRERGTVLARGDDNCRETMSEISLERWLQFADAGSLKLSPAGHHVHEQRSQD